MDPGERIDIWVIESALGSGGMGSVYRCHNADADRIKAAIKVLDDRLSRSKEAKARFVREAEILFRLDHPNIVQVRNVRMDSDPPYLEMEFVVGDSLNERIEIGPMPLPEAMDRMGELFEALVYLHERGIRHRDIKPDNLLVSASGLKLVDFGLAIETEATRITQSGVSFGTIAYVPPEWMDPDQLDPVQWDLYAAGVVFYELLTGERAFPMTGGGSHRNQMMRIILRKQTAEPLDPGPEFPHGVRKLIQDLTRVDPSTRPESAEAVRDRLSAVRQDLDRRGWGADEIGAKDTEPMAARRTKTPMPQPAFGLKREEQSSLGLSLFWILLAVVLVLGIVYWLRPTAISVPGSRYPVTVTVEGVPEGIPVDLRLASKHPGTFDQGAFSFAVPAGPTKLHWAVGEGCSASACAEGTCGDWCGSGAMDVDVPRSDTPHLVDLAVNVPAPNVTFQLQKLKETQTRLFKKKYEVRVRLGDRSAGILEGWRAGLLGVRPGKYELTVEVGECEDENIGCWPGGVCPIGCTSMQEDVVIPWQEDSVLRDLHVPVPYEG